MTHLDVDDLEKFILGQASAPEEPETAVVAAQTGILSLDLALGRGLPAGVVELCGEPSTGKTTLAGQIMAHCQHNKDRAVGLFPSETPDLQLLQSLGVDLDQLPLLNIKTLGPFLDEFPSALVVIDSISALDPAKQERSAFLFDLLMELNEQLGKGQCVVCTSHVRARRSAEPGKKFAAGSESANRRFTDLFLVRLELRREAVSAPRYTMLVNILANILAPPGRYVRLPFKMGYGVDRHVDMITTAEPLGVVEKRGQFFYLEGEKLGHGLQAAARNLQINPAMETKLLRLVLRALDGEG